MQHIFSLYFFGALPNPATNLQLLIEELNYNSILVDSIIVTLLFWILYIIVLVGYYSKVHVDDVNFWQITENIFYRGVKFSKMKENKVLEFIWTVVPGIIILLMMLPSIIATYLAEIAESHLTPMKIIGNQWFWTGEHTILVKSDALFHEGAKMSMSKTMADFHYLNYSEFSGATEESMMSPQHLKAAKHPLNNIMQIIIQRPLSKALPEIFPRALEGKHASLITSTFLSEFSVAKDSMMSPQHPLNNINKMIQHVMSPQHPLNNINNIMQQIMGQRPLSKALSEILPRYAPGGFSGVKDSMMSPQHPLNKINKMIQHVMSPQHPLNNINNIMQQIMGQRPLSKALSEILPRYAPGGFSGVKEFYAPRSFPDIKEYTLTLKTQHLLKETSGSVFLLVNEKPILLPIFQRIPFVVTSNDVIHSFALPECGIKIDAISGRLNQVYAEFVRTGNYAGMCSELCGVGHAKMPINIAITSMEAYKEYLRVLRE